MRVSAVERLDAAGTKNGEGQRGLEGGCGCVVVAMARVLSGYQRRGLEGRLDLKAESGEKLIWSKWSSWSSLDLAK